MNSSCQPRGSGEAPEVGQVLSLLGRSALERQVAGGDGGGQAGPSLVHQQHPEHPQRRA